MDAPNSKAGHGSNGAGSGVAEATKAGRGLNIGGATPALLAEWAMPLLLLAAALAGLNFLYWWDVGWRFPFGERVRLIGLQSQPLDKLLREQQIDSLIAMSGNGPILLSPDRRRKGRPDSPSVFPSGFNVTTPPVFQGRVRIGDVRCCGSSGEALVSTVALYDERFLFDAEVKFGAGPQSAQTAAMDRPPSERPDNPLPLAVLVGGYRLAVLDALQRGSSSIAFDFDEDGFNEFEESFDEALEDSGEQELANALVALAIDVAGYASPLRRIYLAARDEEAPEADDIQDFRQYVNAVTRLAWRKWIAQVLTTRLPYPDGRRFTASASLPAVALDPKQIFGTIDPKKQARVLKKAPVAQIDAPAVDPGTLFNPNVLAESRVTPLPAVAGVLVWLVILVVNYWRAGWRETSWSRRGMAGGALAAAVIGLALFGLDHLWLWAPDSSLATAPGLIAIMIAVGGGAGFLHVIYRKGVRETLR